MKSRIGTNEDRKERSFLNRLLLRFAEMLISSLFALAIIFIAVHAISDIPSRIVHKEMDVLQDMKEEISQSDFTLPGTFEMPEISVEDNEEMRAEICSRFDELKESFDQMYEENTRR